MNTKICKNCKQDLPISAFHKASREKLGVRANCKLCRNIEGKKYKSQSHVKERCKQQYQENKEQIRDRLNIYYWTLVSQYHGYKKRAKEKSIVFELSKDECSNFYNTNCYYCGDFYLGLGIDRVDNSLGYKLDNVVSCCKWCNYAKNVRTQAEFFDQCFKIISKLQDTK